MSCCVCVCVCVCVVNELSAGGGWTSLIATVCIYTLLKFLQGGGAGALSVCSHKQIQTKSQVGEHEPHLSLFLVGTSGFISNLRQFMWIKVQQFTSRGVQVRLRLLLLTSSSSVCFLDLYFLLYRLATVYDTLQYDLSQKCYPGDIFGCGNSLTRSSPSTVYFLIVCWKRKTTPTHGAHWLSHFWVITLKLCHICPWSLLVMAQNLNLLANLME